jgi:predicted small metal-binding protein
MKTIRCECGFVARGDDDDEVVALIRGHLAVDHPALLDAVDDETLVSWIRQE